MGFCIIGIAQAVTFSGLSLTDAGHNAVTSTNTLLIGLNGGGLLHTTFGAAATEIFLNVTSIKFAWGGNNANDFYVNGATAVIPLPAACLSSAPALAYWASWVGGEGGRLRLSRASFDHTRFQSGPSSWTLKGKKKQQYS